eukprot:TRINITY_DN2830_c0_g1_i2.p1 TRINITY_DN2830_c0_g1~~TRINITY_DN2830_c0_g1_i2.p1  ORF type:complete len:642 (+),score=145.50 TRINITY_DN2830_c0_g1_i2:466-2391(+)
MQFIIFLDERTRTILEENSYYLGKIKDLESQLADHITTRSQLEGEIQKFQAQTIEHVDIRSTRDEIERLNHLNTLLVRRFRLIQEYQYNEINKRIESTDDSFGCVCGGEVTAAAIKGLNLSIGEHTHSPRRKDEMTNENHTSDQASTTAGGDGNVSNDKEIQMLKEKLEVLNTEITQLQVDKADLTAQLARSHVELENQEEMLYNSEIYQKLLDQVQDLGRYCVTLKQKLKDANRVIDDLERLRLQEIKEVIERENEEKNKLFEEMKKLRAEINNLKSTIDAKDELIRTYDDLSKSKKELLELTEISQDKFDNLSTENVNLRKSRDEVKKQHDQEHTQFTSLREKYEGMKVELETYKALANKPSIEHLLFKHPRQKEIFNELYQLDKTHSLGVKDKLDELKLSVKNREEKYDNLKKKYAQMREELSTEKKQREAIIAEAALTANSYSEMSKRNRVVVAQLKEREDIVTRLMKTKAQEKAQWDQEKNTYLIKLKVDSEVMERRNQYINELTQKLEDLNSLANKLEAQLSLEKSYNIELMNDKESLLKNLEDLRTQNKLMKEKLNSVDLINGDTIKELERVKSTLQMSENFINMRMDTNRFINSEFKNLTPTDFNLMTFELSKYKVSACQMDRTPTLNTKFRG